MLPGGVKLGARKETVMFHFARYAAVCVLAAGVGASACAALGRAALDDLTFSSAAVVDLKDQANIVWLSKQARPSRPMAALSFSARTDLTAFAHQHEYNFSNVVTVCNQGKIDETKELQNDAYVYDDDGTVDAYQKKEAPGAQPKTYHVYVYLKPIALAGKTDAFAYDLQHRPEELCIQLQGGNMLGSQFSSNVLVVPKEAIASAISRAGLP